MIKLTTAGNYPRDINEHLAALLNMLYLRRSFELWMSLCWCSRFLGLFSWFLLKA